MVIDATITVQIEWVTGPKVQDPDHVRRWLCADGIWLNGSRNGFTYEVCPHCPNPDDCDHDGEVSIYRAMIVGAEWEE